MFDELCARLKPEDARVVKGGIKMRCEMLRRFKSYLRHHRINLDSELHLQEV